MLRKAQVKDQTMILDLIAHDPSRALFLTGDILQNGFDQDYQEIWLDEDKDGVHAIYLRYHSNLILYVLDHICDEDGLIERFNDPRIRVVSGTQSHLNHLPESLKKQLDIRVTYLCECKNLKNAQVGAVKATLEDAAAITQSFKEIEEFGLLEDIPYDVYLQRLKDQFQRNTKIAYVVHEDDRVVSCASTSAQSHVGVMIVGVFTLKAYRNRGYARQVMSAITKDSLDKGLVPCLFYDNPNAGALYHHLGYETIDQWILGKKRV